MSLVKGAKAKTRKGFSDNVKREMDSGKPQKQAVAIAYATKREAQRDHHSEHSRKRSEDYHNKIVKGSVF